MMQLRFANEGAFAGMLMLTLSAAAFGQESRATLTGTVTDAQGATVPRAAVAAKNTGTGLETKASTNEAGLYVLPFLNTGTYQVTVTAPGFKSAVSNGVVLGVAQRQQLDFKLEVGG